MCRLPQPRQCPPCWSLTRLPSSLSLSEWIPQASTRRAKERLSGSTDFPLWLEGASAAFFLSVLCPFSGCLLLATPALRQTVGSRGGSIRGCREVFWATLSAPTRPDP